MFIGIASSSLRKRRPHADFADILNIPLMCLISLLVWINSRYYSLFFPSSRELPSDVVIRDDAKPLSWFHTRPKVPRRQTAAVPRQADCIKLPQRHPAMHISR